MTAANGTHPVLASAHAASQQLRPMTSARAAGLRKAPQQEAVTKEITVHCLATRPITDRNPHAGISRAPERRRQSTATTCARTKQNTADLARVVIDAMAVAGCRGWNCDIAWQPPANCCHRHPRLGSPPSLSGFNGHCAPHDDCSRVKPGSPHLAARPFSYGASPCLPPSTGRMELTPDERLRVTGQSSARRSAAPIFRGWRME